MNIFSKKLTALILALAVTAMCLPITVSASANKSANLIADNDPGFESRTVSSTSLTNPAFGDGKWISRGTAVVDDTRAHSGNNSVKITGQSSGPRAVITGLTEGKLYYVSAWVYTTEGGKKMKIGIGGSSNNWSDEIQPSENRWTQVTGVVAAPAAGDAAVNGTLHISANSLYLNPTTSYTDFWVDDFEICEVTSEPTAEVSVLGNLIASNGGFELGNNTGWRTDAPKYFVINSSVDANSGNYAAHTTRRTQSYETPQIFFEDESLEDNTYYYARAMARQGSPSESPIKAKMVLQKTVGTTNNAVPSDLSATVINESTYTKVASIIKNIDATQVKLYVATANDSSFVDLWTDDYALVPITASVAGRTDVVPNSTITLSVPEDLNDATLSINKGAEITNITKSGLTWTVSLDKMCYGVEYALKLNTDLNQNPTWTFTTVLDENNLLKNHDPGFESRTASEVLGNSAWNDQKWIARGSYVVVDDKAHTGAQSVMVTSGTGPRAVLTSSDLTEGKLYYVSAYLYTETANQSAAIGLGGSAGWSSTIPLVQNNWTKVEGVVVAPAAGDAAVKVTIPSITDGFGLYISNKSASAGTLWYDDFEIYEVDSYYFTDFSRTGNTINCAFTNFKNNNNLMLAVVSYDASGRALYIDIDTSLTKSGNLSVTAPTGAYASAQVFLWDAETLAPIVDAIPLGSL